MKKQRKVIKLISERIYEYTRNYISAKAISDLDNAMLYRVKINELKSILMQIKMIYEGDKYL